MVRRHYRDLARPPSAAVVVADHSDQNVAITKPIGKTADAGTCGQVDAGFPVVAAMPTSIVQTHSD